MRCVQGGCRAAVAGGPVSADVSGVLRQAGGINAAEQGTCCGHACGDRAGGHGCTEPAGSDRRHAAAEAADAVLRAEVRQFRLIFAGLAVSLVGVWVLTAYSVASSIFP